MRRVAKFIAWFVAALIALFVVAAIAFSLFFDANDFREDIASAVEKSTGREVAIEGDVSLKLFPWLAVEVGQARLGNAQGFGDAPFAAFERAELSVRLWPLLLRREITIGKAEIDGLLLNLEVNDRDVRNWSDLIAADEDAGQGEAASGGGSFEISGVAVRDATISYVHRLKGDTYALSDVNLTVGRVSSAGGTIPADGSLSFEVLPAGYTGSIEIETSVTFDRDAGTVVFGESSLDGIVEGVAAMPTELRFATAGIAVDTNAKTTAVQPLELSVLGIDMRAEVQPFSYADTIQPTASVSIDAFSPRSLMTMFDVEPPETADPVALSRVIISAEAEVRDDDVRLGNLDIKLDDTTLKGSLVVPMSSSGRFRFDLDGDAIDLNRYMAPAAEGDAGGPAASAETELPVELIRPLNANGGLKMGSVRLADLELQNVTLGLETANGRMRIHPITAQLYGGSYSGDVRIDASGATPTLSLNETVEGVDLAQLVLAMFEQENITGSIAGNFRLNGRGADTGALRRTLNGSMSFELEDGTYEGTDLWYELRRARALLKKEQAPEPVLPARTRFSSVKATGVVTNGVMRNEDFVAELPFMQLTGKGTVNLVEGKVDYALRARVYKKPEAMTGATPEEIEDFTKTVIPLRITGPLTSPKVSPDLEGLLKQRVEEEIKEKLEDKLKDIFKR